MKRIFWLIFLALIAGLAWWGVSHALVPESAAAVVTRGTANYVVIGSVTVSAEASSNIASPADGIVLADGYNLADGREVKAGDLLARLDPGDIPFLEKTAALQLAQTKAQLDPDKKLPSEIDLAIAQQDLDDATPLFKNNYFPPANYARLQQTVAEKKALADQERLKLETDAKVLQNQLDNYDDQLKRLNIVAPYDGFITAVIAHPGDQVALGATVAGLISSTPKIEAEVNQDDIAAVHDKETATVNFFAYPGTDFPATVERVLPSSDPATQRFTVVLNIPNPPKALFAGLTGEVKFAAGEHPNALLIPRRALFGDNVVVVKDGVVEVRKVKTGYLTLQEAEITDGLAEGDVVLTEDLNEFRTGDRVRLTNNPAAK